MSNPPMSVCDEAEIVRQLTQLLEEEQRWLAREVDGSSPYLGRRAALLEVLDAAARSRLSAGPLAPAEASRLRSAVLALEAAHARSLEMVRARTVTLERVRARLARRQAYGHCDTGQDRLGQG